MLGQCWANVVDGGPVLAQHRSSVSCLLGYILMVSSYIAYIQCSVLFTHITPGHWTCSFFYHFNSFFGAYGTAAISALETNRTHSHLCPTKYSFTPESNEAWEDKVPWPRTQHLNNVPILRREKQDISLKILHQTGFESARQATLRGQLVL